MWIYIVGGILLLFAAYLIIQIVRCNTAVKESKERLAVYGAETAERMLEVEYTEGDIRIYGLTGSTELEKNNKSYQSFLQRR